MDQPKYKRILLKLSGEALAGQAHRGLDFDVIGGVCDVVKQCVERGVQVGIVVGGGNFWRGVKDGGGRMERSRADHMGMLATVINCLAIADCLEQRSVEVRVQTAIEMNEIAEPYIRGKAVRHLERGASSSSAAEPAIPIFPPIPARCFARRKLARTPFCLRRISTAYTAQIRKKIPRQRNSTRSLTTRCLRGILPLWIPPQHLYPWTTTFPFRCLL